MFTKRNKISQYTSSLSSSHVTPSNSLSDIEWDNETSNRRKTTPKHLPWKIMCYVVTIAASVMIAIAILVPLILKSKSTITTKSSTTSESSTTVILNVSPTATTAVFNTTLTTTTIFPITVTSTNASTTTSTSAGAIITTQSTTNASAGTTTTTESTTSTSTSTTTTTRSITSSSTDTTTTTESTTSTSTSTTTTTRSTTSSSTDTTTTTESTTSTSTSTITTTESTTSTSTGTTTTTGTSTSTSSTVTISTTSITMAPLRWNTSASTIAGQLSMTNATPYYLNYPLGIFIDSFDSLYVADCNNNRVQQFLFANTSGNTLAGQSNGLSGATATRLNSPSDVAVDLNENIYVADMSNHRIQLWRVNATSGITVAGTGTSGNSTTQLNGPRGVALDPTTNILYVSDSGNHRIMQYTSNSTIGAVIAGGNGPGLNQTQLNNPRGLYFESSTNSLLIANYGANNIVRWVIGNSNWTLIAGDINGAGGSTPTRFSSPSDVVSDPMGNIYVADRYNYRVQFFLAGHYNGTTVAGISTQWGSNSTMLNQISSIALDSQLNLYVSDTVNNRIQQFARY